MGYAVRNHSHKESEGCGLTLYSQHLGCALNPSYSLSIGEVRVGSDGDSYPVGRGLNTVFK